MRKLIDVNVLEADVEYWENHDDPKKPDYDKRDIEQVIGSQPIVDAVEVVRCKDCKWWKTNYMWNGSERKVCVIEAYEPMRNESDYCSRGERREDDGI